MPGLLSLAAFRLPLSLAAINSRRRAASLLLLLLLQLTPLLLLLLLLELLALGCRRLTLPTLHLHSFPLGPRFIRLSGATLLRRNRLMKSRWTSPRSALFRCSHGRPGRGRAEPYPLIGTLWRILRRLTLPWPLLLTWTSRWRATILLLLRSCAPYCRRRCCSPCSGGFVCSTGRWRSCDSLASGSAAFELGR